MHVLIETLGAKLKVRDGLFEIQYFEDERLQKEQFAPSQVDCIWLNDKTSVSVAALMLAIQHDVDLVITDHRGDPVGRLYPLRPSTTTLVQKAQALISCTPRAAEYARQWTLRKLDSQQDLLLSLRAHRDEEKQLFLTQQAQQIRELKAQISLLAVGDTPAAFYGSLRGLEGTASRVFYQSLAGLLPRRYAFTGRSRRPAQDAFNAFLNYAFAMLYGHVERSLVAAGVNPYLGFMHRDGHQFKSMVFDFIEPFRADTVQVVFRLFSKKLVNLGEHTRELDNGGVWLAAPGKKLLIAAMNDHYQKTKVEYEGARMRREQVIRRAAQQFAHSMVEYCRQQFGAPSDPGEEAAAEGQRA